MATRSEPGRHRVWRLQAAVATLVMVTAGVAAGCGGSHVSAAEQAAQQGFLAYVHDQDPSIGRSDSDLLGMGKAVCTLFASGLSFQTLADQLALGDGNLPTPDLGVVITAAAENLCPKYRSDVT